MLGKLNSFEDNINNDRIYKLKQRFEPRSNIHSTETLQSNTMETEARNEITESLWKYAHDIFITKPSEPIKQDEPLNRKTQENEEVHDMIGTVVVGYENNNNEIIAEDPSFSSSYTLASDQSIFSEQVDDWLGGSVPESAGVQHSRIPVVQRSTLATSASLDPAGIWYFLALLLPLFSIDNFLQWTCNTSNLVNATELILAHLSRYCVQVRAQIQRIAEEHLASDLFATLMDIILVLYAMGFLILYLYQAIAFP